MKGLTEIPPVLHLLAIHPSALHVQNKTKTSFAGGDSPSNSGPFMFSSGFLHKRRRRGVAYVDVTHTCEISRHHVVERAVLERGDARFPVFALWL